VRWRGMVENAPAGVAPVARAQVVRGAVAASMVVSWRLILRTPNRSHRQLPSPCRPARRALLCREIASAAPGRHGVPFPAFASSLQSFHSMPRAGNRTGVGVAWALTLHLRWIILGATPTPALRVISRFRWRIGSKPRELSFSFIRA